MRIPKVIARINAAPMRYYPKRERVLYPWQRKKTRHAMGKDEFRKRLLEDLHGKIQ